MIKIEKIKFSIIEAKAVAEELVEELRPHCERVEILGSIRRNKEEVSDIDLIMIPKKYESGLFSTGVAMILDKFEKDKGNMEYSQTRNVIRIHPIGIKIDCYFCELGNYGLIKAIRTGSADFNRTVLIPAINKSGYKCKDGQLTYEDELVEIEEEMELFKLIRLAYVEPEERSL